MEAPLDPVLATIAHHARGHSLFDLPPVEARKVFDGITAASRGERPGIVTDDRTLPLTSGGRTVRIYRPVAPANDMTMLFLHGGGYMLGGLDQMDGEASFLAASAGCVVLSVDYRLSPEHRLPAAHDDAVNAVQWAIDNISTLGGNPDKIALAGESAGANLAASAAIALRDMGVGLAGTLLFVPAPDFMALLALDSAPDFPMLSVADLAVIARACLPDLTDAPGRFPYSAAHAATLAGYPPTVIGLAGYCPTLPVGKAFAGALGEAGVIVHTHVFENMFHPFLAFTGPSPAARAAVETMVSDFLGLVVSPRGQ